MNRKLKKLIRNPRAFFRDAYAWKWARRVGAGWLGAGDTGAAQPHQSVCPPEVPGLEAFELVGDNWLASSAQELPIAVLWGFNPWKREFVARYLPEYRVAFSRGHTPWVKQRAALDNIGGSELVFIAWGMNEPEHVREYSIERSIPLYRMEDGFIRSAALGSAHTVALSLVLDKRGIYFDASRPSDIEVLLNEYAFDSGGPLMMRAKNLLEIMRGLEISKYSLDGVRDPAVILGPKIRRRILVLGQVDDDASIRYGMVGDWNSEKLVDLARKENPDAQIIYKPHPDVLQGFRKNAKILADSHAGCRVLTEEVTLTTLLKCVDHVYTITSLSGLEALIHGLPVTVVGAPFYAGWGLTDDRCIIPRRSRRLSLEELFCAAYLLYPRYLPCIDDPIQGALAAMLKISADRRHHALSRYNAEFVVKHAAWIGDSEEWPVLLRTEFQEGLLKKYGKNVVSLLPVHRVLRACPGEEFQRSLSYLLIGRYRNTALWPRLLAELRRSLRPNHFAVLLTDMWRAEPSATLLDHWAWHCDRVRNVASAREALQHLAVSPTELGSKESGLPIPSHAFGYSLKLAQFELKYRNLERAREIFNHLLLSGYLHGDVISGLAEISRLRFDFASSAALLSILAKFDPAWRAGGAHVWQAISSALAGDSIQAIRSFSLGCAYNVQSVEAISRVESILTRKLGDLPFSDSMLAACEVEKQGTPMARAKALVATGRAAEAETLLLSYDPLPNELQDYCIKLSLAYSVQGKIDLAKQLIRQLVARSPTLPVYREALRLAVLANDYLWGQSLYDEAASRDINIGDLYHRKIRIGLGDIKGSYLSFRDSEAYAGVLKKYLPSTYVQSLAAIRERAPSEVLVVGVFGPGDELRFASQYRRIVRELPSCKVRITCEPRLCSLFTRSFPGIEFVAVKRTRSLAAIEEVGAYSELPGSDLHLFFDNEGWRLAKAADCVTLLTDLLGDLLEGYESFDGQSYLTAHPSLVETWRSRLMPYSRPLVGLSWRSSLRSYARDEHYLEVGHIERMFETSGVIFVNLQSDECRDELDQLHARFPGRMINFEDIDQFNDFESTAALISCLDLVIAPATTVFELAGALGAPTWLLSNSSELHWRKHPLTGCDVWHSSMEHVQGDRVGDKDALVSEATRRLTEWESDIKRVKAA